ncbi:MAG: hypothetical protein ACLQSX_03710, partial [Smithella sp.]
LHFSQVLGVQDQFCATARAAPLYLRQVKPEMFKIVLYGIAQMSYNQRNYWVGGSLWTRMSCRSFTLFGRLSLFCPFPGITFSFLQGKN